LIAAFSRHLSAAIKAGLIEHVAWPDWSQRRLDLSPVLARLPEINAKLGAEVAQKRKKTKTEPSLPV